MVNDIDNNEYYLVISRVQRELLLGKRELFCDDDVYRHIAIALREENCYRLLLGYLDLEEIVAVAQDIMHESESRETVVAMEDLLDSICSIAPQFATEPEVDELDVDIALASYYGSRLPVLPATGPLLWSPVHVGPAERSVSYVLRIELDDNLWRRVIISAESTLAELNDAIYRAFDRYDRHLYSFYLPVNHSEVDSLSDIRQNSIEFTLSGCIHNNFSGAHAVDAITIAQLGLKPQKVWWYLFDLNNDQCMHRIITESVISERTLTAIPAVAGYAGFSPRQYQC